MGRMVGWYVASLEEERWQIDKERRMLMEATWGHRGLWDPSLPPGIAS